MSERSERTNEHSAGLHLLVDDDDLASCVACGLCLPHCPTYRVTGEESASPRGRIAAMRSVQHEGAPADAAFVGFMDACVQCRGCETACPSGVPFGRLMEGTREALAEDTRYQPGWKRLGYRVLGHHRLLLGVSSALAVAQRARLVPARAGLPRLPVRRRVLRATPPRPGTEDVWLFTGCVMDAWQRPVHAATVRVLEAAGAAVRFPAAGAACCGALATHAGLTEQSRTLARQVMAAVGGDDPVLVNSAGCGAALKDYGHLLGSDEAAKFAARVLDVHEWLAPRVERLPAAADPRRRPPRVAVQDACHLRHVQRAHQHVRTVLAPYAELIELDDDGLCCGAGGAYAAQHPELAGPIRDRKVAAVARAGADEVVSANPGCALHLAAGGLAARHPMEIVDEVIRGGARHGR